MSGALHDLPELQEFIECDLAISVEVNCVKEFVGGYLSEAHLGPVLLRLGAVDGLVAVFVENLEDLRDGLLQVC